jgi:predicted nucleic acid-binding protein
LRWPFLDTNVLVYALSADPKRHRAQELLAAGGTVSVQVLNELVNVLLRKLRRTWPEIEAALEELDAVLGAPIPLTFTVHRSARWLARDHGFAFYDALIVAAALDAGCDTLLTEDMQDGRQVAGLTIANPFK